MATQKDCSYAEKKRVFANPTCRVKDRAEWLVRTYLGIKMTPAGALMPLQKPSALKRSRRFPPTRGGRLHCLKLS
jgi:hypothetical protein